ncbi:MAG: DUF1223 domain-containing protein [Pseudomonadota bacterium]
MMTPAKAENGPIVLELFTSQSCSSCPPADKILEQLSEDPNVIALSCHVTYWNHLHWKDTLSKEFCTNRQRQYVQSMNLRSSYTPQIVINGQYEMVGSRGSKIDKRLKSLQKNNSVHNIDLFVENGVLTIQLPSIKRSNYNITLMSHGDRHTQSIPSGENRGRTVSYTNPVEQFINLGEWDGSMNIVQYNLSQISDSKGLAVLVQEKDYLSPIIAAGKIKL